MLRASAIMPALRVGDMQKAIEWYTDRLGFELCWRKQGDGGGENCMSVKDKVDLVWPLETMDYGTVEFRIRDCDGYVLAFAEQRH